MIRICQHRRLKPSACPCLPRRSEIRRDFRRIDKCPGSDIPSRVAIGMIRMTAPLATKLRLRGAITALDMLALGTHLRGVFGINHCQQDAGLLRLVGDKLAELVEAPRPHAVSLRLAKTGSLADAFEFLKSNPSKSIFSLRNDALGKDVIGVAAKPALALGGPLELLADALALASIRRLVCCRLKGLLQSLALHALGFYIFATVQFAIRIGHQVFNAEVHAEVIIGVYRRLVLILDRSQEKECAIGTAN